jgi:hypothetical protein
MCYGLEVWLIAFLTDCTVCLWHSHTRALVLEDITTWWKVKWIHSLHTIPHRSLLSLQFILGKQLSQTAFCVFALMSLPAADMRRLKHHNAALGSSLVLGGPLHIKMSLSNQSSPHSFLQFFKNKISRRSCQHALMQCLSLSLFYFVIIVTVSPQHSGMTWNEERSCCNLNRYSITGRASLLSADYAIRRKRTWRPIK